MLHCPYDGRVLHMNSLIRRAALAAAVTTVTLTTPAVAMRIPEDATSAAKPHTQSRRIDFVRYCDDGGLYQTHKLRDDGPAFIEGTGDKFVNVEKTYDGPEHLYTCGYIVLSDPELTGTVYSIRVQR
jgi:hypothetical protein